MRMRSIVICFLPDSTESFHIFPQTVRISKNKVLNKQCVFDFILLYFFSETFLFLWISQPNTIINVHKSLFEAPIIVVRLFFLHCHHMSRMDLVASPPSCGRSVTDFRDLDAHEAQLRCSDEVDGDIWIWSDRRGLKIKFY
jgi:hypothetical protein